MDRDPVTQDDPVFQIQREKIPAHMEDATILDVATGADPDRVHIAAQQAVEPDIGFRPECDVTDDGGIWGNKNGSIKLGMFPLKIQNNCFPLRA
jgi:hypothetical protein